MLCARYSLHHISRYLWYLYTFGECVPYSFGLGSYFWNSVRNKTPTNSVHTYASSLSISISLCVTQRPFIAHNTAKLRSLSCLSVLFESRVETNNIDEAEYIVKYAENCFSVQFEEKINFVCLWVWVRNQLKREMHEKRNSGHSSSSEKRKLFWLINIKIVWSLYWFIIYFVWNGNLNCLFVTDWNREWVVHACVCSSFGWMCACVRLV